MKKCTMCGAEKPEDEFRKERENSRRANCKACDVLRNKEWRQKNIEHLREYNRSRYNGSPDRWAQHIKRKFGIKPSDYEKMLKGQNGCCAICGEQNPHHKQGRFNIDHCHTTGEIRGLLCWGCNVAIGKMEDSPERLRKAADYLEQSLPNRRKRS